MRVPSATDVNAFAMFSQVEKDTALVDVRWRVDSQRRYHLSQSVRRSYALHSYGTDHTHNLECSNCVLASIGAYEHCGIPDAILSGWTFGVNRVRTSVYLSCSQCSYTCF